MIWFILQEYLKPAFTRFGLPANLDCGRFLANDETYLKNYANHRISQNDDVPLAMDCASIRERHFFPDKAMSRWESEFPIAFARTVYKASVPYDRAYWHFLGLSLYRSRICCNICASELLLLCTWRQVGRSFSETNAVIGQLLSKCGVNKKGIGHGQSRHIF